MSRALALVWIAACAPAAQPPVLDNHARWNTELVFELQTPSSLALHRVRTCAPAGEPIAGHADELRDALAARVFGGIRPPVVTAVDADAGDAPWVRVDLRAIRGTVVAHIQNRYLHYCVDVIHREDGTHVVLDHYRSIVVTDIH